MKYWQQAQSGIQNFQVCTGYDLPGSKTYLNNQCQLSRFVWFTVETHSITLITEEYICQISHAFTCVIFRCGLNSVLVHAFCLLMPHTDLGQHAIMAQRGECRLLFFHQCRQRELQYGIFLDHINNSTVLLNMYQE